LVYLQEMICIGGIQRDETARNEFDELTEMEFRIAYLVEDIHLPCLGAQIH